MTFDLPPAAPDPSPILAARGTSRRQWLLLTSGFAVVVALCAGLLLGHATAPSFARVESVVDLGFARDMSVHHAQAVEMSSIVHRRTDDPTLAYLSFDILASQQGQIGLMSGWLELWQHNQTDSSAVEMAWMGHPQPGPMPGMATKAEVAGLLTLPVPAMNEQFLRLMIRHHAGAVPMAEYAATHAVSEHIAVLARKMVDSQTSEIEYMQRLLAEGGVAAETPPSGHGTAPTAPRGAGHPAGH